jgi:hypothetical protein
MLSLYSVSGKWTKYEYGALGEWKWQGEQYRQCTITYTEGGGVHVTIVILGKQCITYSECVPVTLVIQHAMHMRRIISPVASLAVPYFCILSHKWRDYRKIVMEYQAFKFLQNFVWNISHSENNS